MAGGGPLHATCPPFAGSCWLRVQLPRSSCRSASVPQGAGRAAPKGAPQQRLSRILQPSREEPRNHPASAPSTCGNKAKRARGHPQRAGNLLSARGRAAHLHGKTRSSLLALLLDAGPGLEGAAGPGQGSSCRDPRAPGPPRAAAPGPAPHSPRAPGGPAAPGRCPHGPARPRPPSGLPVGARVLAEGLPRHRARVAGEGRAASVGPEPSSCRRWPRSSSLFGGVGALPGLGRGFGMGKTERGKKKKKKGKHSLLVPFQ